MRDFGSIFESAIDRSDCDTCDGHGLVGGYVGSVPNGFYDEEPCPECSTDYYAREAVESGTRFRAAAARPALDRPASEWTAATRIAAVDELAHIFGGPHV